jgi:hypothetical protein
LLDIEDSCKKYVEVLLPALFDARKETGELYGTLLEIAEEFRHLKYHLHDPKFLRELLEVDEGAL